MFNKHIQKTRLTGQNDYKSNHWALMYNNKTHLICRHNMTPSCCGLKPWLLSSSWKCRKDKVCSLRLIPPVLYNIKTHVRSANHWPTILTWFIVTAVWTLEATASTRALILKKLTDWCFWRMAFSAWILAASTLPFWIAWENQGIAH